MHSTIYHLHKYKDWLVISNITIITAFTPSHPRTTACFRGNAGATFGCFLARCLSAQAEVTAYHEHNDDTASSAALLSLLSLNISFLAFPGSYILWLSLPSFQETGCLSAAVIAVCASSPELTPCAHCRVHNHPTVAFIWLLPFQNDIPPELLNCSLNKQDNAV